MGLYKFYLPALLMLFTAPARAGGDISSNQADYQIKATLLESDHELEGEVEIHYHNRSADTLREIAVHLWPNAYSWYNTALARQMLRQGNLEFALSGREDLGAIGDLEFTVNDVPTEYDFGKDHRDIAYLRLEETVAPGESAVIATPFRVRVPEMLSRLGRSGDFYAISQWFPKVAVYDEAGWQAMPYLDQGEFYDGFGKYVVSLRVPERFEVAATGNPIYADTSAGWKTLVFEQENARDFAWFASPDFRVLRKTIDLDGRPVMLEAYYLTDEARWLNSLETAENALRYFDALLGPYPFDHCTLVEGFLGSGDGMEYPSISLIADTENAAAMEFTIAHEIVHNWWPMALGTNERRYPWLDEGLTTYYGYRYNREAALKPFNPQEVVTNRRAARLLGVEGMTLADLEKLVILQEERNNRHQPVGTASEAFTAGNYALQTYNKAARLFEYAENIVGTAAFDACMRRFYEENRFTLVSPENLRAHLESCGGADLAFLFEGRVNSPEVADARLTGVREEAGVLTVDYRQRGPAGPLPLHIETATGDTVVWTQPGAETLETAVSDVKRVSLDPDNLSLDYNPRNNSWKSRGFKRMESLRPQFVLGVERGDRTPIYFAPLLTGNVHDKFMLGLAMYNRVYPARDFEWTLAPVYAFGSKQANGLANFKYTQSIRRERQVQIAYNLHFKTFSYDNSLSGGRFLHLRPGVAATILPADRTKGIHHEIRYTHYHTWMGLDLYSQLKDTVMVAPDSFVVTTDLRFDETTYPAAWVGELRYGIFRDDARVPVQAALFLQFNNRHVMAGTELNFKMRYGRIERFVSGRFYLAGFAWKADEFATSGSLFPRGYRSGLGGSTGRTDFLFDSYFLGRGASDGLAAQQVNMDRGQFKFTAPTLLRANAMVAAVNIRADFPVKWVPIKLYMDFGLAMNEPGSGLFGFQAGAMLSFFDEGLEIYFPFFSSDEISGYYDLNVPKYKNRITFSFDLGKINPHGRVGDLKIFR